MSNQDDDLPSRYKRRRAALGFNKLDDYSDRCDRYSYFRDLKRDLNSRVSLPKPLSDFDMIEVGGKLSISIDELTAAGII
jgi:hypothetical protein